MEVQVGIQTRLCQRFKTVRQQSVKICEPLDKEDYVVQPVADVSPPKWHLAHTTWFFENFVLSAFKPHYKVFDEDYSYIFNSYYESVGRRVLRAHRGNLTRPSVDDVYAYRSHVDEAMAELLSLEDTLSDRLLEVLEIGLQHEQQHQELLVTDIKYILGHNPLFPCYLQSSPAGKSQKPPVPQFMAVPEGIYQIGHQQRGFCFDNELGVHPVFLQEYQIMDRLVTNGEYLEFMKSGGYEDFRHWLMEGWEWVRSENHLSPLYWHRLNDAWHSYTLRGLEPLDWHAPVTHINYFEADAYARWRGLRLPTEFEWETACRRFENEIPRQVQFQDHFNFLPRSAADPGYQFFGEAWEWTCSAYLPYPKFETAPGALGEYNGKFMINQMVLRGGSCATPRDHIRSSYRNFFHPHLRWQFTGIRLAASPK